MKRCVTLAAAAAVLALAGGMPAIAGGEPVYRVVQVLDGDTIMDGPPGLARQKCPRTASRSANLARRPEDAT